MDLVQTAPEAGPQGQQRAEGRGQGAEGRGPGAGGRGQRAEGRGQRAASSCCCYSSRLLPDMEETSFMPEHKTKHICVLHRWLVVWEASLADYCTATWIINDHWFTESIRLHRTTQGPRRSSLNLNCCNVCPDKVSPIWFPFANGFQSADIWRLCVDRALLSRSSLWPLQF